VTEAHVSQAHTTEAERGRMGQRVSLITLGFTDLVRARAFYEELGWTPAEGTEPDADIFFYEGFGMIIALWDRAKLAVDTAVSDNGGWAGSRSPIAFVPATKSMQSSREENRQEGRLPVPVPRHSGAAIQESSWTPVAIPGRLHISLDGHSTRMVRSPCDATSERYSESARDLCRTTRAPGYSSLFDDLTNGRRMKLEALHGTVVRRAHRHEIPVPVTETNYAILRPWAVRNEVAAGS
jgi:hypothetical protein